MRGGVAVNHGADTCIYNPPVKCVGREQLYSAETNVSRVVLATTEDVKIESRIRGMPIDDYVKTHFISAAIDACNPDFRFPVDTIPREQFDPPEEPGGCNKVNGKPSTALVNLITPKFNGGNLSSHLVRNGLLDDKKAKLALLASALFGSVYLVPDQGPWIVHMDLHFGNILVQRLPNADVLLKSYWLRKWISPLGDDFRTYALLSVDVPYYTALADWGRVIFIENPNDTASVAAGVTKWSDKYNSPGIWQNPRYTQHPPELASYFARGMNPPPLSILRGIMPYTILRQCGFDHNTCQPILGCKTQSELMNVLERVYNQLVSRNTIKGVFTGVSVYSSIARRAHVGRRGSVFAKEELSCRVRTPQNGYVFLQMPEDAAERNRIQLALVEKSTYNIATFLNAPAGIYMWIFGVTEDKLVEVVFVTAYSPFEVASAHYTIAKKYKFKYVFAAGEVLKKKGFKTGINFQSGTYMSLVNSQLGADVATYYGKVVSTLNQLNYKLGLELDNRPYISANVPVPLPTLQRYWDMGIFVQSYDTAEICSSRGPIDAQKHYKNTGGRRRTRRRRKASRKIHPKI